MSIQDRLKGVRALAHPLSARELSLLAGLGHSHVATIEAGDRVNISPETVTKLARVLGCDEGWLMFGSGDPPSKERVLASVGFAKAAPPKTSAA